MKQLSDKDRKKVMDVLAKCAAKTKDITDAQELNDSVYDILHKEFPNQPQLIKRACQAYNSAKSLHKLSTATDNNRGDDFSILDPNAMYDRAKKEGTTASFRKAASALGIKSAVFSKDAQKPMSKAASANPVSRRPMGVEETPVEMSQFQINHWNNENIKGFEQCILKCASNGNRAARDFEMSKAQFIRKMASTTSAMRKEAAELLHAYYGETGDAMINAFNEAEPLKKVASYNKSKYKGSVSLPNSDLYKSASEFVGANDRLKRAADMSMLAIDLTIPCLKEIMDSRKMTKEAALPSYAAVTGTALGISTAKNIPELVGLDDPDENKTRRKIYTTELINRIKEHSIRRAFMDMLLDPSIQKYPLDKILNAYNMSLKETPINMRGTPDTANLGLIKARTLALLSRGGVPSAGDADTIMNIQKVYGRIDPDSLMNKEVGAIA